jgi:rhodanese-related sulfurtransferase
MKKQSNGLVWGSLLLGFGLLTLAKTLGWYHIDWGQLLRFWPVLLILAGISLLVGRGQTWAGPVTALLLAIALPSAMINKAQRHFGNNNFSWNGNDFNYNDDENDSDNNDDDNIEGLLIPLADLPHRIEEIEDWRDEEVLVHCRSGKRSETAQHYMENQGFTNVRNVIGGILAYREL